MSTGLVTMAGGKRAADQDFVDLTIDSDDEAPLVSPAAKKGAAAPAIVARLGLQLCVCTSGKLFSECHQHTVKNRKFSSKRSVLLAALHADAPLQERRDEAEGEKEEEDAVGKEKDNAEEEEAEVQTGKYGKERDEGDMEEEEKEEGGCETFHLSTHLSVSRDPDDSPVFAGALSAASCACPRRLRLGMASPDCKPRPNKRAKLATGSKTYIGSRGRWTLGEPDPHLAKRTAMQKSKLFGRVRVRLDELHDDRSIDFAELLKKNAPAKAAQQLLTPP